MDAPPGQGVQVDGHGGDERLAFARLHLGDLALVEDHAADQLHIEGPHPEGANGRFADDGEGLFEQLVESCGAGGLELLFVDAFEGFREPQP